MQESAFNNLYINISDNASVKTGREIKTKVRKLNLRKKNLNDDSNEITEISEKYPDLLQLNLSYNNLSNIPQNLFNLKNLLSLDLRKNAFKDMNKIIEFLSQFKFLTDLKIDFSNSSQVQTLLNIIPNIRILDLMLVIERPLMTQSLQPIDPYRTTETNNMLSSSENPLQLNCRRTIYVNPRGRLSENSDLMAWGGYL